MTIKVGIVGTGSFAQSFIPLLMAHPGVSEVVMCDIDETKLRENVKKYNVRRSFPSLETLLASDIDAVAIFSQHWLHAPQAIEALKAGKHVYSAVPAAISMEEIDELVNTVKKTGLNYMMGETSYYYPTVIYCREQYNKGAFGDIVHSEASYMHDMDHGLYDVYKWRGGSNWKEIAGTPPMYYPTHSTSQIISVTGAHMTHVSCHGFVDKHEDGLFKVGVNKWNNIYSNQTALFKMSDGSTARISEFRRVGYPCNDPYTIYGTRGSFEKNGAGAVWMTKQSIEHSDNLEKLDHLFKPINSNQVNHESISAEMNRISKTDSYFVDVTAMHDISRLPKEFAGLPNGHYGSHQFLVDDFVKSCNEGTIPPNNVWQAARYLVPGLIAHESSKRNGELMKIPDYGDAPSSK